VITQARAYPLSVTRIRTNALQGATIKAMQLIPGLTNSVNFIEIRRIQFHQISKSVILLFIDSKYLKIKICLKTRMNSE
jgi:hypothetical protein